jgi:hypothetical protein
MSFCQLSGTLRTSAALGREFLQYRKLPAKIAKLDLLVEQLKSTE